MIILGIDPGLANLGWAVISPGPTAIAFGAFRTNPKQRLGQRFIGLSNDLMSIIKQRRPDIVAIEHAMGMQFTQSAQEFFQAVGVVLLTCEHAGLMVAHHKVGTWKKGVTGNGAAKKPEIQAAMQKAFGLKSLPTPDHAADALGIALHHLMLMERAA